MLLTLSAAAFGYDDKTILSGLDLTINEGDRIGLIGTNGAGKTTLLKILLGSLRPTEGELFAKNGLTAGYLPQNSGLDRASGVFAEMKSVFVESERAIARQRQIEREMGAVSATSPEYRKLSSEYARLTALIDAKEGYQADVKIKTVLNGMGFQGRYDQRIDTMSGGEKTRLALAKLLLENPELLVLDEPTNHLDFKTLAFLEDYLAGYKGAILIVSHDRYFLDKMVTRIWDLEDGKIEIYRSNYSKYRAVKAEIVKNRIKEYEKQSERIAAMKDYAARNIVRATTSKSAKSRLHQLENIMPLEKPVTYRRPPAFSFETDEEPAKVVLTVSGYDLRAGDKALASGLEFSVSRGERVAIIGANGTGKSTFMRALARNDDPHIQFGKYVKLGYYDQENLNLDFDNTVIGELWGRFHLESQTKIRAILARMLLGEEDIDKQIKVLSGGERAKLGFALVMAERGNVLLLDEPTNHLDLGAREALEEALKVYAGTVIFVSHDRYFLNALATRTVELTPAGLTSYAGNYDEYLAARRQQAAGAPLPETAAKTPPKGGYRSAKDRAADARRKQKLKETEEEISALEEEEKNLLAEIASPEIAANYALLSEKCARLEQVKTDLERLLAEWERLAEEM